MNVTTEGCILEGSPPVEKNLCIRNHEEGNGKPPSFIYPTQDMDIAILLKDNGINEAPPPHTHYVLTAIFPGEPGRMEPGKNLKKLSRMPP